MENSNILKNLKELKIELKNRLDNGDSLREISKFTYELRESGKNIPYFSISQIDDNNIVTRITSQPISKQKELKKFFLEKANNSVLPKYQLYIDIEESGVIFSERLGKGKNNIILL